MDPATRYTVRPNTVGMMKTDLIKLASIFSVQLRLDYI